MIVHRFRTYPPETHRIHTGYARTAYKSTYETHTYRTHPVGPPWHRRVCALPYSLPRDAVPLHGIGRVGYV